MLVCLAPGDAVLIKDHAWSITQPSQAEHASLDRLFDGDRCDAITSCWLLVPVRYAVLTFLYMLCRSDQLAFEGSLKTFLHMLMLLMFAAARV